MVIHEYASRRPCIGCSQLSRAKIGRQWLQKQDENPSNFLCSYVWVVCPSNHNAGWLPHVMATTRKGIDKFYFGQQSDGVWWALHLVSLTGSYHRSHYQSINLQIFQIWAIKIDIITKLHPRHSTSSKHPAQYWQGRIESRGHSSPNQSLCILQLWSCKVRHVAINSYLGISLTY